MMKLHWLLVVLCVLQDASAARIESTPTPEIEFCSSMTIRISGEIRSGDAALLQRAIQGITERVKTVFGECVLPPTVLLSSKGGDVAEALTMGALIRDAGFATTVYSGRECFSSCVFLFAAGVERRVARNGQVGIHRPYLRDVEQHASVASIRGKRASQIERMRSYIERMDLSPQLLDAMLAVPPDEIRILTAEEMRDFRITGTDASFDEYRVGLNAKMFDLSSSEYRRRSAIAEAACANAGLDSHLCVSASILGISVAESRTRWARYEGCKKDVKNEPAQRDCFRRFVAHGAVPTGR